MENQEHIKVLLAPIYPMGIPLYISEGDDEMTTFNLASDFCSLHGYNNWRANTHGLYLLRGKSREKDDILMAVQELPVFPVGLERIPQYIQHMNHFGKQSYHAVPQKDDYRSYTFRQLYGICGPLMRSLSEKYSYGRGQNHLWVAERISGKRILIIHF